MKFSLLIRFGFVALFLIALLAPFTFLKTTLIIEEEQSPAEQPTVKVAPPKVIVEEKPLHAVILPEFRSITDVKTRKREFFAFMRPTVEAENAKIMVLRNKVIKILDKLSLEEPLTDTEREVLTFAVTKYRVGKKFSQLHQAHKLLEKIDIIPVELVLVQAANESAWGTSRFARLGLNYFGIWCYKKGCGLVPRGRNVGAKHEVEAFKSLDKSVERYLVNINTNNAYMMFRTIRAQLRANNQPLAPEILATGLLPYSQRGIDYVLELTEMIRHNHAYFVQTEAD